MWLVWLDLPNANGSVPYTLIEYAMELYHILDKGLSGALLIRFTVDEYTTS